MSCRIILCLVSLLVSIQTYTQNINASIVRVLVDPETDSTTIFFTGSNNPEVTSYKIVQWVPTPPGSSVPSTGVPLGSSTIYNTGAINYTKTIYVEDVLNETVGFSVDSYNSEGNFIDQTYPPDSTIHVSAIYDPCQASVSLNWNDYNAWRGNIDRYEVLGKNENGNISLGFLPEGVTDTIIYSLESWSNYLFFIVARRSPNTIDNYVTSNGVKFETTHLYYPEYIHADYGTVDENNRPQIQFTIDPLSSLETFKLLRATDYQGTFDTIATLTPSSNVIEYTDMEVDASQQAYYYKLFAINECSVAITESENLAGTIHLTGEVANQSANLTWTAFQNWPAGIENYIIKRSFEGEDFVEISRMNATQFSDASLNNFANQTLSSRICYRVTAIENAGDPNSSGSATSLSNSICVTLPVNIEFEFDAFVPGLDGFTSFGPTMDFLPAYFDFKIFNRSGSVVFKSNDPSNSRWDGRYRNGNIVSEGIYRYQLQYKDEAGNPLVIQGKVTVVRQ